MSYTAGAPEAKKTAYQRPYKSRGERRETDRRKYDEARDHTFLWRMAGAVGLLLIVVLGFTLKGLSDRENASPQMRFHRVR